MTNGSESYENEYERHLGITEKMVDEGQSLQKEREEILKLIVGLQDKLGKNDQRVKDLYKELDDIERRDRILVDAVRRQIENYPTKSEHKNLEIEEINNEIKKLQQELVQINIEIRDSASKLNYLSKNKNTNDKEIDEEIKKIRILLDTLEEKRSELKQDIELLEQEKRLIIEE